MSDEVSATEKVREFYAAHMVGEYAAEMDKEVELIRTDLERFAAACQKVEGAVVDSGCGTGHMLAFLSQCLPGRAMIGVDLSPDMVAIAQKNCPGARVMEGNMTVLEGIEPGSAAGMINSFCAHHVDVPQLQSMLRRHAEILRPGGVLLLMTWEGKGAIEYPETMQMKALYHPHDGLQEWCRAAGLEPVPEGCRTCEHPVMGMNMSFVLARKSG